MKFFIQYFDKIQPIRLPIRKGKVANRVISLLQENAAINLIDLFKLYKVTEEGLSAHEYEILLDKYGPNEITYEKRNIWPIRLIKAFGNPLILMLLSLAAISLFIEDPPTAIIISIIITVSILLAFFQENQAYNSAESLRSIVKTTCTVIRNEQWLEVDLKQIVPGDILHLSAGDIVPADSRLISSKELFINQSLLTGESMPSEKHADFKTDKIKNIFELQNICFMGTNVESGTAKAIVLGTGTNTYFGSLAKSVVGKRTITSFDKGVQRFTWLMIGFMAFMIPIVFLANGLGKGNWWEAFLFAVSVAVGLTPGMLPAMVAVNLSKGAIQMSKKKVIVKRLSSIQNFGAMDILCTDKTGTLTQNKIALIKNVNIYGDTSSKVLDFAYLNSAYQTGFKNLLDDAVLIHVNLENHMKLKNEFTKIDEMPFDFMRKRLSVVVKDKTGQKYLICKGAVEEVASISTHYELNEELHKIDSHSIEALKKLNEEFSNDAFRVIAVAYKKLIHDHEDYSYKDEKDLIFLGFMTFFDPPKESAISALYELKQLGVNVKVLTGDNELVTRTICKQVGLPYEQVLLGNEIESMQDAELSKIAETTTIFAKLSPEHKKKVVQILQLNNHTVGYLGDGINDAPALRVADVGISVDSAVDIAKETADIILLEMSLNVLSDGVIEGRKVFGNILKYIKMGASSNFGNMFSVLGASLFLPFLPMAPLQLLTNNLLYDISQTAIPTDNVDTEYIAKPRKWVVGDIRRFMIWIGPISSIFDYATFGVMIFIFHSWTHNASLFQTGWFVESLLTQTLIVHVIRSKKLPLIQTWARKTLLLMTALVMIIGIIIPMSPIGPFFGFTKLPILYYPILLLILISYIGLTQLVKTWYINKFGYN